MTYPEALKEDAGQITMPQVMKDRILLRCRAELVGQGTARPARPRGFAPAKKRLRAMAVGAAACLILCVPVLAATVPAFYEALYAVAPATAQLFKPVALSCEDQGIRMEVSAVYIQEDTIQVYLTMEDLKEDRIDGTMDLFDSYSINTPFDCTGHCTWADYDPQTGKASLLITMTHWGGVPVSGEKLTFTVREFLSHKKELEGPVFQVSLAAAPLKPQTQSVPLRGYSGSSSLVEAVLDADQVTVLQPSEPLAAPTEGVSITALGYVDGCLRVQAYYEDILKTDNHGFLSLRNKTSGEVCTSSTSLSFFDEEGKGSYQDYLFPDIPPEELENYELWGSFVTSQGSVQGNWSVTVPLEERSPTA